VAERHLALKLQIKTSCFEYGLMCFLKKRKKNYRQYTEKAFFAQTLTLLGNIYFFLGLGAGSWNFSNNY